MKDNELINFVDWLIKSEEAPKGSSFEETVSWINELSSTDDGKKILNQLINTYKGMNIFKDGGKLRHLLCLKSGGKGPDCGCNKKIVKARDGNRQLLESMAPEDIKSVHNGTYRRSYTDEFGNKINVKPLLSPNNKPSGLVYQAITPQKDTLYASRWIDWSDMFDYSNSGTGILSYDKDDTEWKRSAHYYPTIIDPIKSHPPMMNSGGEISRKTLDNYNKVKR